MCQDQEGEVWGINNFHSVWESMCLTYIAKNHKLENVLYLDPQFISDNISQSLQNTEKVIDLSNIFQINGSYLRPDAVMYKELGKDIPKREYIVTQHFWDDYGYKTTVHDSLNCEFRVAYLDQKTQDHTINELKKFYKNQWNSSKIIDLRDYRNYILDLFTEHPQFMDGYIKLITVDFETIAKDYIS